MFTHIRSAECRRNLHLTKLNDSSEREIALAAYRQGYELGKGVEELQPIHRRVLKEQFKRWWDKNGPDVSKMSE